MDENTGEQAEDDLEGRYLARAAARVDELRPDGTSIEGADVEEFQDRIRQALEDQAVHELREIVSQVRGNLDIAAHRGDGAKVTLEPERVDKLRGALDRAEAVLETHLDRSTVHKLLVRLDVETFDLAGHLRHFLTTHGLDPETPDVRAHIEEVAVEADRAKVVQGLGHVALHLYQRSPQGTVLVVDVRPHPSGGARGHIALDPPPYEREALVEDLDRPFRLGTMEIDLPYVRAVLERHGGGIHVAEAPGGGLGYGFHLPASPPEVLV